MVEFSYKELAADLSSFAEKEGKFLSGASPGLLREAAQALQRAANSPNPTFWEVKSESFGRIETAVSIGECELGQNVAWTLKGALSFEWEIQRTTPSAKHGRFKILNATNKLRILSCAADGTVESDEHDERASWRFEIGDPKHPGTRFHSQVDWPLFEGRRLEVPRLPSIILTPAEALDFLLGELFQRRWPLEQAGMEWQSNQRSRLLKLLSEAKNVVNGATGKSALMHLKAWKPTLPLVQ